MLILLSRTDHREAADEVAFEYSASIDIEADDSASAKAVTEAAGAADVIPQFSSRYDSLVHVSGLGMAGKESSREGAGNRRVEVVGGDRRSEEGKG